MQRSNDQPKRGHSVKVPRLYKVATSILKSFKNGEGSVKTLVYDAKAKKKHPNVKAILALVTECLKYESAIEEAFVKLDILTSERPLDKNLAFILTTELLFGKKTLPGESKPVETIMKYHDKLKDIIDAKDFSMSRPKNPRYVRVNLLKTTLDLALTHFKREGYEMKPTSSNYQEFIKRIKSLNEFEFMLDFHMPTYLLVFPHKTQFYEHPLYQDGSLVLQDKASCLSVEALNPPIGCTLLDSCAAPGMKTCQAAVSVCGQNKEGCVIAVERNEKRYRVLQKLLYKHCGQDLESSGNLKIIHSDFLQLNPDKFTEVEYMIVDPTCSGSGAEDSPHFKNSKESRAERLSKLANLQSTILQHAFKFPGLKKLAYSTCSINVEENENVVNDVLKHTGQRFQLIEAMPHWTHNRGIEGFEKCLRVEPNTDLSTGFFVAVFQRFKNEEK